MNKRDRKVRDYSTMSATELDAIAAKFDRTLIANDAKPLTPGMKEAWRRFRRRRGRPRVGEGAEKIRISIERALLRQADAAAREEGLTRSQFIAKSVQQALRKAG